MVGQLVNNELVRQNLWTKRRINLKAETLKKNTQFKMLGIIALGPSFTEWVKYSD